VDSTGHVGVFINTGAGAGYIIIDGIGVTSGKRANGVVFVSASAPSSPGFVNTPHALNANGSNLFYFMGTRHAASTAINIAVDGSLLGTITSDRNGAFYVSFSPAASPDSSHVWTAYLSAPGSLAGTSLEYQADADAGLGGPNSPRAYFDRPVVPSGSGGTIALAGEGFLPGETVTLSGCGAGSSSADATGAVGFFLEAGAGVGNYNCTVTGGTSGRVARATARGDSLATNAPAGINLPATLRSGATSFIFLFNRLTPSELGTIFIDGVSQGTTSTDGTGKGAVILTPPTTTGPHAVFFHVA